MQSCRSVSIATRGHTAWRAEQRVRACVHFSRNCSRTASFMVEMVMQSMENTASTSRSWSSNASASSTGRIGGKFPLENDSTSKKSALKRQWKYNAQASSERNNASHNLVPLRVVSYNVLAPSLCFKHQGELYPNSPQWQLHFPHRFSLLMNELKEINADLICLQEVEQFEQWKDKFGEIGYEGSFTSRSGKSDGCAMFWRRKKLVRVHQKNIFYADRNLKDNVGQLISFRINRDDENNNVDDSKLFTVANTHILFNPARGDIKFGQVRTLLEESNRFVQSNDDSSSSLALQHPIIVCGDFNCTPDSALYRFIVQSQFCCIDVPKKKVSGQTDWIPGKKRDVNDIADRFSSSSNQNDLQRTNKTIDGLIVDGVEDESFLELIQRWITSRQSIAGWTLDSVKVATGSNAAETKLLARKKSLEEGICSEDVTVYHPLQLASVYKLCNGEPQATSFHEKFAGTTDYIFVSKENVYVRAVLNLPSIRELMRIDKCLPSHRFGSDHMLIASDIDVKFT